MVSALERPNTQQFVYSLYLALLGRDPDLDGFKHHVERLESGETTETDLAAEILRSEEYCEKCGARGDFGDIATLFNIVLRRDPDSAEVNQLLAESLTMPQLLKRLVYSDEYREKVIGDVLLTDLPIRPRRIGPPKWRVLFFGAYANGNLGDRAQAKFLADLLIKDGVSKDLLAATSWEHCDSYEFPGDQLKWHSIINFDLLSVLDMLVIGGGGLLGAPHYPLYEIRWVEALIESGLPYALCGIGTEAAALNEPHRAEAYKKLVQNAAFVSGRDTLSIEALTQIRPDVHYMMDPVLYDVLKHPVGNPAEQWRDQIAVILRPALSDHDCKFIEEFSKIYQAAVPNEFAVIFLEPNFPPEQNLMAMFPSHHVCRSMDDIRGVVRHARAGISMRLHGLAALIGEDIPVAGLSSTKVAEMLNLANIGDQYFTTPDRLIEMIRARDYSSLRKPRLPAALMKRADEGINRFLAFARSTLAS